MSGPTGPGGPGQMRVWNGLGGSGELRGSSGPAGRGAGGGAPPQTGDPRHTSRPTADNGLGRLGDELGELRARFRNADAVRGFQTVRPPTGARPAAVLILLSRPEADFEIVFVEKTTRLRSHAGQIAFPGGTMEADETDPVATALREAREETGIDPATVEVVGVLPAAHIVRSGFDVTSVVGWWTDPVDLAPADDFEIAAVHRIRVPTLLDAANRLTWVLPSGFRGPAFVVGDLFIWGFTAFLLDGLFELLDWAQPWDESRTSPVPRRFFSPGL